MRYLYLAGPGIEIEGIPQVFETSKPGCLQCFIEPAIESVLSVAQGFSVMEDAESPRTVSDFLFTRCEQPPSKFQLDNGCNLAAFLLNREPAHFENMQVLVDEPHYRGHVNCSPAFNTGAIHCVCFGCLYICVTT